MKLLKIFIFGLMVILIPRFVYSQGWYAVTITNTQSQATPAPFQQEIAICNGNPGLGSNFINNATIFSEIDSNGQNVYFSTTVEGTPNIYSWYEGQENFNGIYCDVWWINLPNGIPANSNVTIYMLIGNYYTNYYPLYYPYVGEAPQLSSTYGQYDNGNYVFLFYDNFAGTSLNTSKWSSFTGGRGASITVNNGITINGGSSYAGVITLSGFNPPSTIADIYITYASSDWPVISMTIGNSASSSGYFAEWSGTSVGPLYQGSYAYSLTGVGGYTWNYPAIVSESWQTSKWQIYGSNYTYTGESLTTYSLPSSVYYGFGSVYYSSNGTITVQWIRVRSYPPNGVMPSISIQLVASVSSVQLYPLSSSSVCPSTQTSSAVIANLYNPNDNSITVTFSCSAPSDITCSFNSSSCTTSGSSCSTTLYVNSSPTTPPGSYSVIVTASTLGSSASATYTYNIGQQISISSQLSSNFQNSYSIYITGCSQNYTLYVNNSPYCYDSYPVFQNISALCTVSYPGSYSVYAQGCYNGTCVNSNTINLNIQSGITVPIIDINILNITNQNINTTISVNGSNQNIQSINVYYNNNNVYSNSNVNTNYYSFNLQLSYSNNGNITVCSTLTNGQSNCIIQLLYFDIMKIITYYGIIVG